MSRASDGAGVTLVMIIVIQILTSLHWLLPLLTVFILLGVAATLAEALLGVDFGGRRGSKRGSRG